MSEPVDQVNLPTELEPDQEDQPIVQEQDQDQDQEVEVEGGEEQLANQSLVQSTDDPSDASVSSGGKGAGEQEQKPEDQSVIINDEQEEEKETKGAGEESDNLPEVKEDKKVEVKKKVLSGAAPAAGGATVKKTGVTPGIKPSGTAATKVS